MYYSTVVINTSLTYYISKKIYISGNYFIKMYFLVKHYKKEFGNNSKHMNYLHRNYCIIHLVYCYKKHASWYQSQHVSVCVNICMQKQRSRVYHDLQCTILKSPYWTQVREVFPKYHSSIEHLWLIHPESDGRVGLLSNLRCTGNQNGRFDCW